MVCDRYVGKSAKRFPARPGHREGYQLHGWVGTLRRTGIFLCDRAVPVDKEKGFKSAAGVLAEHSGDPILRWPMQ